MKDVERHEGLRMVSGTMMASSGSMPCLRRLPLIAFCVAGRRASQPRWELWMYTCQLCVECAYSRLFSPTNTLFVGSLRARIGGMENRL